MRLYIGKNKKTEKDGSPESAPVQSIFRLMGNDEDALTYALGYLMTCDSEFCAKVIRLFIGRTRAFRSEVSQGHYAIHLQEVREPKFGRRDIVVEAGGRRLIVEAKVGGNTPSANQLLKYAAEPNVWGVVSLTKARLPETTATEVKEALRKLGRKFFSVQWHKITELALEHYPTLRSETPRFLFSEFIRYMREEYEVGYYDAEVSIQDVDSENEKIFKSGWIYITAPRDKKAPLYFAPYFTGQSDTPGISMMARVLGVEMVIPAEMNDVVKVADNDHLDQWREGLRLIRERSDFHTFAHLETRLLYLDEPVQLRETPITKKESKELKESGVLSKQIPTQIPKGFSLDFSDLFQFLTQPEALNRE